MIRETIKLEHVESTDALVEYLQSEHSAGNVRMLMVVYTDRDGNIICHHNAIPSTSRALGALELLKDTMLKRL